MTKPIYAVSWYHPPTGAAGENLIQGRWQAWRQAVRYARAGYIPVNIEKWARERS